MLNRIYEKMKTNWICLQSAEWLNKMSISYKWICISDNIIIKPSKNFLSEVIDMSIHTHVQCSLIEKTSTPSSMKIINSQ